MAPTTKMMRRQRVKAALEAVARAIIRSSLATKPVSAWVLFLGVIGWLWAIAPTLLDGGVLVNHLVV